MIDFAYVRSTILVAALVALACVTALPAHAKIEPVRSAHPGLVEIAAQSTPPPGEQAPGPERDDAVLGAGDSTLSWWVAGAIALVAIIAALWWGPEFLRQRRDHRPPVTPSRGPAQTERDPGERGH